MSHPRIRFLHEPLPGASGAFLVNADNGRSYAVKFAERTQNGRLGQAREFIACHLGALIGAPVPESAIIELTQEFLDAEDRLRWDATTRPAPGLAVGMAYVGRMSEPPEEHGARLAIVSDSDVAGVVVFDSWIGSGDRSWQNYVFSFEPSGAIRFRSIDFADSMTGGSRLVGIPELISRLSANLSSADEWVGRIEGLSGRQVASILQRVPHGWLAKPDRQAIYEVLCANRGELRAVIGSVAQ